MKFIAAKNRNKGAYRRPSANILPDTGRGRATFKAGPLSGLSFGASAGSVIMTVLSRPDIGVELHNVLIESAPSKTVRSFVWCRFMMGFTPS